MSNKKEKSSPVMLAPPCEPRKKGSAVRASKPVGEPKNKGGRPKRNKKAKNILVVGYDPAKSSSGGLAAIYNGKLVWCGEVLLWDIEEELDVVSGFENIRTHWLEVDNFDPEDTISYLYYERSQHGAHFARAAISEAAGAAFPAFTKLLEGKKDRCKPVHPREWRKVLYGAEKQPEELQCKADAMRFVASKFKFFTQSHDIAEAIIIAYHGYLQVSGVELDSAA